MSEHEKIILIQLLIQENDQKTLNLSQEEINILLNKIIKANFIIERIVLDYCEIESRGRPVKVDFDLIKRIHIVSSKIDATREELIISNDREGLHRDIFEED